MIGNTWFGAMSHLLSCKTNLLNSVCGLTKKNNYCRSMQGNVKHQKSINVWGCFSWNGACLNQKGGRVSDKIITSIRTVPYYVASYLLSYLNVFLQRNLFDHCVVN